MANKDAQQITQYERAEEIKRNHASQKSKHQ